jgi:hypothetical protein
VVPPSLARMMAPAMALSKALAAWRGPAQWALPWLQPARLEVPEVLVERPLVRSLAAMSLAAMDPRRARQGPSAWGPA